MRPPAECPVCGGEVPRNARACPHCGADERSGWNEDDARYDGLDLPDSAFEDEDHDAPARRRPARRGSGIHPFWWIVALVLVLAFLASLIGPLL